MKRPKVERKDNTSAIGYTSLQNIRPFARPLVASYLKNFFNFRREAA
ncbi:MAG: hypothetical protein J5486_10305 [Bacteroidaceae bacterium]|nr:hypothetical protein [Bacteroidaceae bacterium]